MSRRLIVTVWALSVAACGACSAPETAGVDQRGIRLADGLLVQLNPGAAWVEATPRGSPISIPVVLRTEGSGTYYVISTNRGVRSAFHEGESIARLPISSEHAVLHNSPGQGICKYLSIGDIDVRKFRAGERMEFVVGSEGPDQSVGLCFARNVELGLSTGAILPIGARMEHGCGTSEPGLEVVHSGLPAGTGLAHLHLEGAVCTVLESPLQVMPRDGLPKH